MYYAIVFLPLLGFFIAGLFSFISSNKKIDIASQISVAAQDAGIKPIVRVPDFAHHHATRVLDCGVFGLDYPHVENSSFEDQNSEDQNQLLKIVKDITSKGFVRNNYKKNLVDLSDVKISLKGKK